MASGLGAGLLALAKGRQGYNQGKDQQSQRESQVKRQQDQERRVILELALEEAGRQRSQANADRSFKLETDKFEFSKRPRPDEGPSWQTQETANGIVQVNPKTGEVRPLQLGQSPLKPKQQKWEVYGPGTGGGSDDVNWQVIYDEDGTAKQVHPRTGEIRDVGQPGQTVRKPLSAEQKKTQEDAREIISTIDTAIAELDKHPGAVGPLRGRIGLIDQITDEKGTLARAGVSDVGSKLAFLRSGGAIPAAEWVRIAPFLPSTSDKNAAVTKQKLNRIREIYSAKLARVDAPVGGSAGRQTPTSIARGDQYDDHDYYEMLRGEGGTHEQAVAKVEARRKRRQGKK